MVRATAVDGSAVQTTRAVTVTNLTGPGSVRGRVFAVGPVVGAEVTIKTFSNLEAGAVLGQGTTDALGRFDITVDVPGYDDLLLIEAGGSEARYSSPSTGGLVGLGGLLGSVVSYTDGLALEPTVVTPLTTLGAQCAAGRAAQGDAPADAVSWCMFQLREHVHRPDPANRDLRAVTPSDVTQSAVAGVASTSLGLTHAGLDQLAYERALTLSDVVVALAADLSDARFNGQESGVVVALGGADLDRELTRTPLAAAVDAFLASGVNGTGVTHADLAAVGELYDDLSLDGGPLYPDEPAVGFDVEPPTVTFVSPTPDETAWLAGEFAVVVKAEDKSTPVWVVLLELPVEPQSVTTGPASFALDAHELPNGVNTLAIRADDAAENPTTVERTVRIDTLPPELDIHGNAAWSASTSFAVSGQVTDDHSGVAEVIVQVEAEQHAAKVEVSGAFSVEFELPDGVDGVEVVATDVAGNASSIPLAVKVDPSPPTINGTTPAAGSPVQTTAPLAVSIDAFDAESGVAQAWVQFEGGQAQALTVDSGTVSGSVEVPAGVGPVEVTFGVTNGAGAEVTEGPVTLVRDDEPPSWVGLTLGALFDGVHWVAQTQSTLTLEGLADQGPVNALAVKGHVLVEGFVEPLKHPFGDAGDLAIALNLAGATNLPLTFTVTDIAGNSASTSLVTSVDPDDPVVSVTSHTDKQWVSSANVVLKGTASDGSAVASVAALIGNTATPATLKGDQFTVAVALTGLIDTDVTVEAVDIVGKSSKTSLVLNLDDTPPGLQPLTPINKVPTKSGPVTVAFATLEYSPITSASVQYQENAYPAAVADPEANPDVWVTVITVLPGDGTRDYQVQATNAAGLGAAAPAQFVVDDTPPTFESLELGTLVNGVHWVGSSTATLFVKGFADLPENGSMVKGQISVAGSVLPAIGDIMNPAFATLPLTSLSPGNVSVIVTDTAGNLAPAQTLTVDIDADPPQVVSTTPPIDGDVWTNQSELTFEFVLTDAGSGVASVVAEINGLLYWGEQANDKWLVTVPVEDAAQQVIFTATDHVGHTLQLPKVKLLLDQIPPVLSLESTTFKNHSTSSVADSCNAPEQLEAQFGLIDAQVLENGLVIHQLAHLLKPKAPFLPTFKLKAHDAGTAFTPHKATFVFKNNGALTQTGLLTPSKEFDVPITLAFPNGITSQVPNELTVTIVDQAGNTGQLVLPFELLLYAPPPCIEPVGAMATGPQDVGATQLGTEGAAALFATTQAAAARVQQIKIENPFPIAIQVAVPNNTGSVLRSSARAAIAALTGDTCNAALCQLTNPPECRPCNYGAKGLCTPFAELTEPEVSGTTHPTVWLLQPAENKDSMVGGIAAVGGYWTLPPESTRYLNVGVDVAGTCLVRSPVTYVSKFGTPYPVSVAMYTSCSSASGGTGDHNSMCTVLAAQGKPYLTPRYVKTLLVSTPATPLMTGLGPAFNDLTPQPQLVPQKTVEMLPHASVPTF